MSLRRFGVELRRAASVALVGGVVLGCREALVTLPANAVVQPEDYLLVYLATPILSWVVSALLALVPPALLIAALQRPSSPVHRFSIYAGVLAFAGGLSLALPWVVSVCDELTQIGLSPGLAMRALLGCIAVVVAGAASAMGYAGAAWYATRTERPLRYASRGAAAMLVVLLLPLLQFVLRDWKWALRPAEARLAGAAPNAGRRPNVLLISIDTLRADHLGSYGDPHGLTPNLDRFAAQGVCFEHAISSSPWTLPAMASLFTGLYPHHHQTGQITNYRTPMGRSALPAGSWTLTRALHEHGYRTEAIVTNPYLALRYGLGEDFDGFANLSVESEGFVSFASTTAVRLLAWLWPGAITGDRGEMVSRRAAAWLTQAPADRPFFLWLHYLDPHPPYSAAGVTRNKSMRGGMLFGGGEEVRPATLAGAADIMLTSPDVARLRAGEIRLNAAQKEAVHDLYRAEVRAVDAAVGEVLAALDRNGLSSRTLVVVVADHGEEFWEHGGSEHGRTVYEEVIRVPLLMRWPGHVPAGVRIEPVVRLTDVAPTVLALIGLPVPPDRDGDALLPLIRGEPAPPRVALTENMLLAEERIGIRTADRKYVRWEDGREEVYDLNADPQERIDLAGAADVLLPLQQLYAGITGGRATSAGEAGQPPLDSGTAEAMRALGYTN
jgi:arylsulfatase A-like enzyme